jgi:hypothetical protein
LLAGAELNAEIDKTLPGRADAPQTRDRKKAIGPAREEARPAVTS